MEVEKFKIIPITSKRIIDMTGERYGRLVVLGLSDKTNKKRTKWVVKCDCGTKKIILRDNLTNGSTSSCGCYNLEQKTTHGQSGSRLYEIYKNMKQRCTNPNTEYYSRYGGRGITVCKSWTESYEEFSNWAKNNGYQDDLTIDRINNDGNYEPANCHWVTMQEQNENTSFNVNIEYKGETHHLAEWSRIMNINVNTLYRRYRHGDTGDRLFRPVQK